MTPHTLGYRLLLDVAKAVVADRTLPEELRDKAFIAVGAAAKEDALAAQEKTPNPKENL